MQSSSNKLEYIQALRAIAALMVLSWHFKASLSNPLEFGIIDALFKNGSAGVDIFFVISGFIMVYSTKDLDGGIKNSLTFIIKRLIRIWPMYLLGTLAFIGLMLSLNRYGFSDIKNTLLSLIFYPVAPHPTLDVGWTLNLEVFFYTILAGTLLFDKLRWPIIYCLIALFITTRIFYVEYLKAIENFGVITPILNQFLHPTILEFFVGMVIGRFYLSDIKISPSVGLPIAAVMIAVPIWQYSSSFLPTVGINGYGIGASLLVLGLTVAHKTGRGWKPSKLLLWLGDISYSIYIMHTVIALTFTTLLHKLGLGNFTQNLGYLIFLTTLIISVSALTHHLIEQRLSNHLNILLKQAMQKKTNQV